MEVEHQLHARLLDLLAERQNIAEVLAGALALVLLRGIVGVDEEAHTHGVPALLVQEGQQADGLAVVVLIDGAGLLVGGQQREVATQQALLGADRQAEQQGGGEC